MDVTIGYGGAAKREPARPVFVVRGSEGVAAVGDEGWDELEHAFFAKGAVEEHNTAVTPRMPPQRRVWLWATLIGGALGALIVALVAAL